MSRKYFSMINFFSRRSLTVKHANKVDWTEQRKLILEPLEYIYQVPCKHVMMTAPAFNYWLKVPEQKMAIIQNIIRTWITWDVITDDIQDNSSYRYGKPCAHSVFGVGFSLNSANKALLLIQELIADLENPLALGKYLKRMDEYILAQGSDLYWRDKCIIPLEETHLAMTRIKFGPFSALPVDLAQLFSSNKTDYTELAMDIGSYYAILDDYYNLFNIEGLKNFVAKKPEKHIVRSDITDGKITLAIIHASQYPDVATELADILKQRSSDPKLINRAISLLKKHGSDEYVRDKMRKMEADIRTKIEQLGGNPELTAFMDDLSFQRDGREKTYY